MGLVGLISRVRQSTLNLPVLGRPLNQPPSLQKLLKPVKYCDAVGRRRRLFKLFVRSLAAQINPFLSVRTATCWLPGDRIGQQTAFLGLARRQFIWRNKATDVQDSSLGRSNGKLSYGQPSSPSRGRSRRRNDDLRPSVGRSTAKRFRIGRRPGPHGWKGSSSMAHLLRPTRRPGTRRNEAVRSGK